MEKKNPTHCTPTAMPLVVVESPYAGDVAANLAYARACLRDCLHRGEAPFASHLLYTQDGVLDDDTESERLLGMVAGMSWSSAGAKTVVYTDRGISGGMKYGIEKAEREGRPVEYRTIEGVK